MSHASMAGYFLFFYNRYRKEEILKRKEEKHAIHIVEIAEELGIGTTDYEIINID